MKKSIVVIVALWPALALAGVDLNVNIGIPLPVPPPVVVAPPPGPPQVQLEAVPRFIYSPTLGFYVSVAIPYDIVFYNGGYYLNTSGGWYSASSFNGPWLYARHVPTMLRRYRYEDIRHYRDQEYREYLRDRDHYRGHWYEPGRYGDGEHHGHHEGHHEGYGH